MDNRKLIIANNFEQVFNELGYKKTTVERIAKNLSMSKKTIYKYFSSKDDAYKFLVKRYAEQEVCQLKKELKYIKNELDQLSYINNKCFSKLCETVQNNETNFFSYFNTLTISINAFQSAYKQLILSILESGTKKNLFQIDDLNLYMSYIELIIAKGIENLNCNSNKDIPKLTFNAIKKLIKYEE